jgi:glycosyltransferase involved in cell wall biosynthesis
MRILHCVSSLKVGGAEKCVRNLVLEQKLQGLTVAVLSFGAPSDAFQKEIEASGVKVINITGNLISRTWSSIRAVSTYSTVHVHSPAVVRAFTLIFPVLFMKQVVYTIHGEVEPPISFVKESHQLARLYINRSYGVSENIKAGITNRYGWPKSSVTVIKNGVAIPSKPQEISKQTKLQLCVVCRLVPLKNIAQLIEAFKQYGCSDYAELHIYGDGPEKSNLEILTTQLNLNQSITFYGAILDEQAIYENKDLLLINSTTEGLPMSLLEAMARGIPAVSTSVGEIPNVIENQCNGIVYSLNNLEEWQQQLTFANTDRKSLQEMGAAAYAFIRDQFAIKHICMIYQKSYQ